MRRLNCGCGRHAHPDWTNVDFHAQVPGVLVHDLRLGIPSADESFDCVYSAHMLEHLPRHNAGAFLADCLRVLTPGGILRLVVPDLEAVARQYLEHLERAEAGGETAAERYEWCVIELLDQLTRVRSGGEMVAYWSRQPMPAFDFVRARAGAELDGFLREHSAPGRAHPAAAQAQEIENPEEYARFRQSGELHLWMYDRRSLRLLMEEAGFVQVRRVDAVTSAIPDFARFQLDELPGGVERKPDSLYFEGLKPGPRSSGARA
ncbi:MAG: hypothetical protein A2051_07695 [Desulfovibrionales bacterium GWA2_65_9]|nr:MAG: hypothetical protein A2051_07695 [Desulfovibrionales bacterium GWA2_65_9]